MFNKLTLQKCYLTLNKQFTHTKIFYFSLDTVKNTEFQCNKMKRRMHKLHANI